MNKAPSTGASEDIRRAKYEAAVAQDWRYEQFFRFLRVSPSYLLAHRLAVGRLKSRGIARPRDILEVQAHYKRLGPASEQSYREWWSDTGQFLFGVAIEPEPEVFLRLARMQEPTDAQLDDLQQGIEEYLLTERPSLASPPTLIMALPIHPDRQVLLQAINRLLSEVGVLEQTDQRVAEYKVIRNKIREATVRHAWNVLIERVAAPADALWQIGNRARVSELHITDEGASGDDPEVRDRRRVMAILTSRELQRAYLLAENAARGRFPCLDRLPDDPGRPRFDNQVLASVMADEVNAMASKMSPPPASHPRSR